MEKNARVASYAGATVIWLFSASVQTGRVGKRSSGVRSDFGWASLDAMPQQPIRASALQHLVVHVAVTPL
jgi:hypothetical protein